MRISIFKVKKDKVDKLKKWGEEIEKRKKVAIKTLIEENCQEESLRFFELSGETFVVGAMTSFIGKKFLQPNPGDQLNKKHFEILEECFSTEVPTEKIYNLKVE